MRRPNRDELRAQQGSATVELAILAPALLALLGLVIVAGRISAASGAVEQAASAAARAASLSRHAEAAQALARRTVVASLDDQGLTCRPLSTGIDVSEFAVPVGSPASVTVDVSCTVPLTDLAVPGVPGTRVVTASMSSPIDRFRGRS